MVSPVRFSSRLPKLLSDFREVNDFATVSGSKGSVDDQVDVGRKALGRAIDQGHVDQIGVLGVCRRHDASWGKHARAAMGDVDVVVLSRGVVPTDPRSSDIGETLSAQILDIYRVAIAESFVGREDIGSWTEGVGFRG